MNNEKINTTATEQEDKAVDTTVNILLAFLLVLVGYGAGYYAAAAEAAALVKTILTDQQ
jgi:hypothetical protein